MDMVATLHWQYPPYVLSQADIMHCLITLGSC
jgi:hypothetical protein